MRLAQQPETPQFFTPDETELLRQIATRLLPQPANREQIDVVGPVDHRLANNESDG